MNKHAIIPLVIGLAVGLFALKLGYDHIQGLKGRPVDQGPVEKVVVAKADIPLGTKLTENDIAVVSMPVKLVPEGTVKEPKEVIGQALRVSLNAKMPVLKNMVGPGVGLEGVIPTGYRAVAVKVDEFTSVGGLLRPGVRVDVLASLDVRRDSGASETISKLILQNIEVRAVGQQIRPDDAGVGDPSKLKLSQSVTLLVKSDQAEILNLAASIGSIRLALRSATDDRPNTTKGITLSQLITPAGIGVNVNNTGTFGTLLALAGKRPSSPAAVSPAAGPFIVEVVRDNQVERIYFQSANSDKRVQPKAEESTPGEDAEAAVIRASAE